MLNLFLLRHAESEGGFNVTDPERSLTPHGIEQAKSLNSFLPLIDLAICSPATRTKMTLEQIEPSKIRKTLHVEKIYNGATGDLLASIQSCHTETNLLIIGHNPGTYQLANMLATEDGSEKRNKLLYQYSPATLSILECPIDNWKDIQPAQNNLVNLIIPD